MQSLEEMCQGRPALSCWLPKTLAIAGPDRGWLWMCCWLWLGFLSKHDIGGDRITVAAVSKDALIGEKRKKNCGKVMYLEQYPIHTGGGWFSFECSFRPRLWLKPVGSKLSFSNLHRSDRIFASCSPDWSIARRRPAACPALSIMSSYFITGRMSQCQVDQQQRNVLHLWINNRC